MRGYDHTARLACRPSGGLSDGGRALATAGIALAARRRRAR